jgi:uncharacterized protein (TIGR00369 family)
MTTEQAPRTRTIEWEDPAAPMAAASGRTGLELMQALVAGEVPAPPIAHALGFALVEVAHGRAVFEMEPAEYHYNPIGSVHGGVYATLLDSACGCAVHSTLPEGVGYTSLDLSVRFLGAVRTTTGPVRATGRVRHLGRRTALAEAELSDLGGRLLATAQSSCLLLAP